MSGSVFERSNCISMTSGRESDCSNSSPHPPDKEFEPSESPSQTAGGLSEGSDAKIVIVRLLDNNFLKSLLCQRNQFVADGQKEIIFGHSYRKGIKVLATCHWVARYRNENTCMRRSLRATAIHDIVGNQRQIYISDVTHIHLCITIQRTILMLRNSHNILHP